MGKRACLEHIQQIREIESESSREDKPYSNSGATDDTQPPSIKPLQNESYHETQSTRNRSTSAGCYDVIKYTDTASAGRRAGDLWLLKRIESSILFTGHISSHSKGQHATQDAEKSLCISILRGDGRVHTPESLGEFFVKRSRKGGMVDFSSIDRAIGIAAAGLLAESYVQVLSFRLLLAIENSLEHYIWSTTEFDMEAFNRVINLSEIIFARTEINDPNWLWRARKVRVNLRIRYELTQNLEDIDLAIGMAQSTLFFGSDGSSDQAELFEELGELFLIRWKFKGETGDIKAAIETVDLTQSLVDQSCPRKGIYLLKLERMLREKFQATDQMDDLGRAIQVADECAEVSLKNGDETTWSIALYDLADHLRLRYEKQNDIIDINRAIDAMEKASTVQADDLIRLQTGLENFGLLYYLRYNRTDIIEDLDRAIEQLTLSAALNAMTPHRRSVHHYLGMCYHARYRSRGLSSDLNQAVEMAKLAVQPPLHRQDIPNLGAYWFNLGSYTYQHFIFTNKWEDLQTAIQSFEEALRIPNISPDDRCVILCQLGDSLVMRFGIKGMTEDQSRAEHVLREAIDILEASPKYRVSAARSLANKLAHWRRWEESLAVYQDAVSLLSLFNSVPMQQSTKRSEIEAFSGLSRAAAAVALSAGKGPLEALTILERGRGLLSSTMVDTGTSNTEIPDSIGASLSFSYSADEIMAAAGENKIAVINVSRYRCDAILVESNRIQVVPLPLLDQETIDGKTRILRINGESSWDVLEWLWEAVSLPILQALNIDQPVTGNQAEGISGLRDKGKSQATKKEVQMMEEKLPHIWWIPTGPLNQLPIHASGKHSERSGETVLDRVISSYAVSVGSLLQGRRLTMSRGSNVSEKALVVSMSKTPGQSFLPFAEKEAKTVASLCQSLNLEISTTSSPKRKDEILEQLRNCRIFHFAGHGLSDPTDPSQSFLLLEDWKESPLTVESLQNINLHDNPPFLAYLSACSTGSNKIMTLCDESINLISASQLAGFRHVIGSLWEVNDRQCVNVAKIVYETIAERGLTDSAVALALHRASVTLRNESIGKRPRLRTRKQAARGNSKLNSVTVARSQSRNGDSETYLNITELPYWLNTELKSYRSCPLRMAEGLQPAEAMDTIFSAPVEVAVVRQVPLELDSDSVSGDFAETGSRPGEIGTRATNNIEDMTEKVYEGDVFLRTPVPVKLKRPHLHWIPYVHFGV